MKIYLLIVYALLFSTLVSAGEVNIEFAKFYKKEVSWKVDVTLKHTDEGWDHYANIWRIVDENGALLGQRILAHPHDQEQPFTRSLGFVRIPATTTVVYIEASDLVHGWSKQRVRVDLNSASGDRYQVVR